ncbi:hypothetical protein TNCV_3878571 [Trichonephila clavipes]|nr:hypothetical protein TNCV_3878571 [Trichonephila clavipes]
MIKQGVDSSNGPKTRLPLFPIFISEFCLAMKRTSGRMATSTNKTAAFGVKLIHKCMSKHRYIQKNCLVRFMGWWNPSSKTMKAPTLQSMVIGIEP